jgi:pimeloyl-ACP methyl ester carboxylesterase
VNKYLSFPTHLCFLLLLATTALGQQLPETTAIRHTVDADGHPIAVWAKGPADPKGAIVLIHGRTWSGLPDFDLQLPGEDLSLMDGLGEHGYATYAIDLRGYGGTPRDETGWLSPDRAVQDVIRVLEWVGETAASENRPVLFGWSLGSMVAQLTVQRRPDLVSDVIFFGYPLNVGIRIPLEEDPEAPLRAPTTAEGAASDFITEGSISPGAIDRYVEVALAADPIRTDWYRSHEWMALDPVQVTVPTLLLQGEFDIYSPTEQQMMFFALLGASDKQWVVIPGGDHAALLEKPRPYFISAMVNFIGRPR